MATTSDKIKLGTFLLAAIGLAIAAVVAFAGSALWEARDRYSLVVADSVTGLAVGAPVKIMGIDTGKVSSIELAEDHTRVLIQIEMPPGTRLFEGSIAYIKRQGVTDLRYVDIEQPVASTRVIPPGGRLEHEPTGLDRLTDNAQRISDKTLTLLDRLDEASADVAALAADARELIGDTRPQIGAALTGVDRASRLAAAMFDRADATFDRIDAVVAELDRDMRVNSDELRAALRNIRQASQSVKELSRELRRSPSSLFLARPPKDRRLP